MLHNHQYYNSPSAEIHKRCQKSSTSGPPSTANSAAVFPTGDGQKNISKLRSTGLDNKCKSKTFFTSEPLFRSNHRSRSTVSEQTTIRRVFVANCRRRSTTRIYRQNSSSNPKLYKLKFSEKQCCRNNTGKFIEPQYYNFADSKAIIGRKDSYQHLKLPRRKSLGSESEYRHCCLYCRCWYDVNNNPVGSCSEAPDPFDDLIKKLTCYPLAQAVVYHCCRENDEVPAKIGRYGNGYNIFSYGSGRVSTFKRVKRWLLLVVLTLFAPCLCCYLPLKGIYRCCRPKRGCHCPSGEFVKCNETTSCPLNRHVQLSPNTPADSWNTKVPLADSFLHSSAPTWTLYCYCRFIKPAEKFDDHQLQHC